MSLIGKRAIPLPTGVQVRVAGRTCTVEGPKGKMERSIPEGIRVEVKGAALEVRADEKGRESRMAHGTTRSHLANMVQGVSTGFDRRLEINGVGYKADVQGKEVVLALGFNHPVKVPIPEGVQVKVEKLTQITVTGFDIEKIGHLVSVLRRSRPADPYKEKGIKRAGEHIRRKAGKAAVAKAA